MASSKASHYQPTGLRGASHWPNETCQYIPFIPKVAATATRPATMPFVRNIALSLLLISAYSDVQAQQNIGALDTVHETAFLLHLQHAGLLDDIITWTTHLESIGLELTDTMLWLAGQAHMEQGNRLQATSFLLRIAPESSLYGRAALLARQAVLQAEAIEPVGIHYAPTTPEADAEIVAFQDMGLALLHLDADRYFNLRKDFEPGSRFGTLATQLDERAHNLTAFKPKKMGVAALLSVPVPGLGKVYCGRPLEFLTTFLVVALMGAQATEGFLHRQWRSPHFYAFGAIGLAYYAGGIWGSAMTAHRVNQTFYNEHRYETLYHLDVHLDGHLR